MAAKQTKTVPLAQHEKLLALVRERDQLMCAYEAATLALSEDELIEHERRDWKAFARNHLAMIAMVRPLVYADYRGRIQLLSVSWWESNNRRTEQAERESRELIELFGPFSADEAASTHPLHNPDAVAEFIAQLQAETATVAAPEKKAVPTLGEVHDVLMKQNMKELSLLFPDDGDIPQ